MTTLLDYARTEFPNHAVELWPAGAEAHLELPQGSTDHVDTTGPVPQLIDHTVIATIIGAERGMDVLATMRKDGWIDTAAVLVRPAPATIRRTPYEDADGVNDLPNRRIVAMAVSGFVIGAAALGLVAVVAATGGPLILAAFGGVIGAVIGAMLGGLGRHAGERAWSQPSAPAIVMALIATFARTESEAIEAAHRLEELEPHDVRIVDARGAWHLPRR